MTSGATEAALCLMPPISQLTNRALTLETMEGWWLGEKVGAGDGYHLVGDADIPL